MCIIESIYLAGASSIIIKQYKSSNMFADTISDIDFAELVFSPQPAIVKRYSSLLACPRDEVVRDDFSEVSATKPLPWNGYSEDPF